MTTTGTVAIDLKHDLYGRLLFHGTRFRRLGGYRHLTAKDCWADISPDGDAAWFGSFLPRTCLLGDPGARDATIHALQACVPHATVLPVAVDTIVLGALTSDASYSVSARERSRDGNSFVYDAQILDKSGVPVECWQGLRLQSVGEIAIPDQWPLPLFGAFLERSLDWLFPGAGLTVALHSVSEPFDRRANSDLAIRSALPSQAELYHRSDGRPFVSDRRPFVSAAHAPDLTLAVTSDLPIGCDVEPVVARPRQLWNDLLGSQRVALADLVSAERREDWQQSATRIWCAAECLTKIGAMPSSPLVMDRPGPWGWVLLRSGHFTIATMAASIRGISRPLLFAVGVQKSAEGQPSVLVGAHSAECAS